MAWLKLQQFFYSVARMDDPDDANELVMCFQGSWDFPLSRAEKVRRVLEICDKEVNLAARDADAQKRRADALQDENAVLRERAEMGNPRQRRHTASFWMSSPPSHNASIRCARQRVTSVRWSCRADYVESLSFVQGGEFAPPAGGGEALEVGEYGWPLRPKEFIQMLRGRVEEEAAPPRRRLLVWAVLVTSHVRSVTIGDPSRSSQVPTFSYAASPGNEIVDVIRDAHGSVVDVAQRPLEPGRAQLDDGTRKARGRGPSRGPSP